MFQRKKLRGDDLGPSRCAVSVHEWRLSGNTTGTATSVWLLARDQSHRVVASSGLCCGAYHGSTGPAGPSVAGALVRAQLCGLQCVCQDRLTCPKLDGEASMVPKTESSVVCEGCISVGKGYQLDKDSTKDSSMVAIRQMLREIHQRSGRLTIDAKCFNFGLRFTKMKCVLKEINIY